jgi:hypothetical protein
MITIAPQTRAVSILASGWGCDQRGVTPGSPSLAAGLSSDRRARDAWSDVSTPPVCALTEVLGDPKFGRSSKRVVITSYKMDDSDDPGRAQPVEQ